MTEATKTATSRLNTASRFLGVLSLLCVGFWLAGCVAKPVGYSDYDKETDFSAFRTFAFVPDRTLVVASPDPVNPALEGTLKEVVRNYMTGRGFSYTDNPAAADFLVGFTVASADTVRTTMYIDNYRQVRVFGTGLDAAVVNQQSADGALVIDFFLQPDRQKKWMGWTITEITRSDQVNLKRAARELVGIILGHFPPDT